MSFNRLDNDAITYARVLQQNANVLGHVIDPIAFENRNKCRHELGLVGGAGVSHIKGNLVDLESDLRGQTRYLNRCAEQQYRPAADNFIRNDKTPPIDTSRVDLPSCQMIGYKSVPLPPPYEVTRYSGPNRL